MFLIFGIFFFTAPIQFQNKFDYCKSVGFEAKDNYCETPKKLYEMGKKNG